MTQAKKECYRIQCVFLKQTTMQYTHHCIANIQTKLSILQYIVPDSWLQNTTTIHKRLYTSILTQEGVSSF